MVYMFSIFTIVLKSIQSILECAGINQGNLSSCIQNLSSCLLGESQHKGIKNTSITQELQILFQLVTKAHKFCLTEGLQTPADIEKWPLSFGTVIDNPFIGP